MIDKIKYYQKLINLYEKRANSKDAPKILWYKKKIKQEQAKND